MSPCSGLEYSGPNPRITGYRRKVYVYAVGLIEAWGMGLSLGFRIHGPGLRVRAWI